MPGPGRPGGAPGAASGGPVVGFHFGLGSRCSCLASTQAAALSAETGAAFDRLPLDSRRLIGARGRNPFAVLEGSGQYDWTCRRRDPEAWAEHYGAPSREPHGRRFPDRLSTHRRRPQRHGASHRRALPARRRRDRCAVR